MLILVGAYMARVAHKRCHQDHVDHAMVLVNQVAPCNTNEHHMVEIASDIILLLPSIELVPATAKDCPRSPRRSLCLCIKLAKNFTRHLV